MRADNKAFAKAVASRKTIIFALQMATNIVSLSVIFRQETVSNRTRQSSKTLGASLGTNRKQKTPTVHRDFKLYKDFILSDKNFIRKIKIIMKCFNDAYRQSSLTTKKFGDIPFTSEVHYEILWF